jgi:metal-responsive CopG/Arc/MetJ family transcriptional regulator
LWRVQVAKKVIQVPVDEDLLENLNNLSKKQQRARSEVIRHACVRYLQQVNDEEQDKLYQQGYIRVPEEPAVGEAQVAMSAETLSKESW